MRKIPQLKLLMTPFPYSIGIDATETEALALMHEHEVHHLPVTDGNALVGVITERDIKNLQAGRPAGGDSNVSSVRDMYIHDAYIVDINEYLDTVLLQMAERHIGSALVTRKGKLAGVFTTTDACRGFGEYLQERFPHGGGNEAA